MSESDKCVGCGLSFITDDITICCNSHNGKEPGTHENGWCTNCCPGRNHGVKIYETLPDAKTISMQAVTIATQAAEIARLTVALTEIQQAHHNFRRSAQYNLGINLHSSASFETCPAENCKRVAALLRPQPQPAQAEPETPTLSRYAAKE